MNPAAISLRILLNFKDITAFKGYFWILLDLRDIIGFIEFFFLLFEKFFYD